MSGLGFHAPALAWLLLLVVPLVLLYFLKLRRPRREVPSLVLWQQVIQDRRVNAPFQRFKRNLLFWLQLLLLLLLILAALQPFLGGSDRAVDRLPVLIDCSASMGARDQADGRTRLEVARDRVRARIDALHGDQAICLIAFGRNARRLTGFTRDRRELLDALGALVVEDVASDPVDALRMAAALARTEPFEKAILFTDGNLPEQVDVDRSFALELELLPEAGPNLGITALNARRVDAPMNAGREQDAAPQWRVFVSVEGRNVTSATALLTVRVNGKVVASTTITVTGGSPRETEFLVGGDQEADLHVKLDVDGFDALESDNEAWLSLTRPQPLEVWSAPDRAATAHALQALPDLHLENTGEASARPRDLIIVSQPETKTLPGRVIFHLGGPPGALQGLIQIGPGESRVVDRDRVAPLLQYVDLNDLVILARVAYAPGKSEADLENLGYRVLVHGHEGPLLLENRERNQVHYHLLFPLDRSTLPYRVSFPVLLTNLVNEARREAGLLNAQAIPTGILPALETRPDSTYQVEAPDQSTRRESSDPTGLLAGIPAPHVGVYHVTGPDLDRRIGAALLSPFETGLTRIHELRFREALTTPVAATPTRPERPLWPLLALLALGVLIVEWWVYHRGGRGRASPQ
jgi:VWA domain-containing protein/aerotolerance regulator-like protein